MNERRDASWDYGLEPGESFEPEGWDEEPFELDQPHVMTALGPIDPGALGFALTSQRIFSAAPTDQTATDIDTMLDDLAKAASELEGYSVTGGRAIIDITTAAEGRNSGDLLFIAQRSPVHLVLATGRPANVNALSQVEVAVWMTREITEGIDGGVAKAGVIVGALSANRIDDDRLLTTAADAFRATGVPITLRAFEHSATMWALDRLDELNVPLSRITVANVDLDIDSDQLQVLFARGCYVTFDRWASSDQKADESRATVINSLIEQGYSDQVLISGDLARRSRWLSYGGRPGFVYFLDEVPLMLMEAGVGALKIRSIFVENVAKSLTIHKPAGWSDVALLQR